MPRRTNLVLLASVGLLFAAAAAGITVRYWRAAPPVHAAHLVPVVQEASVAVLPFVDMSGDPAKAYFGEEISGELHDELEDAPDLRVAPRAASFAFKGRNADIHDIAARLRVRTVLEGSVREDGNRVRITAQLINAADGLHLWSQTYDRELSDILSLDDELARAITRALTDRTPSGGLKPKRIDPDAYRKYLEARHEFFAYSPAGMKRALDLATDVTRTAPDFAPDFALLGRVRMQLAGTADIALDDAAAPLDRALALEPASLEARVAHLRLSLLRWDWRAASHDADRLLAGTANNAAALRGLAFYYRHLGFPEVARAYRASAARLDPHSDEPAEYAPLSRSDGPRPGLGYARAGDLHKAMDWFERSFQQKDLSLTAVPYDPGTPRALLDNPRWVALWQNPELKAWQEEHDRVARTLNAPVLR
jgi:TolB-like protein